MPTKKNRSSPSGPTTEVTYRVTLEVGALAAQSITPVMYILPQGIADLGDTVVVNLTENDLPAGVFIAGARISGRDTLLVQVGTLGTSPPLGAFSAVLDVVIQRH